MSEAVSSLLLFARCLFCQRLECLPSWHRLQLWQCQCTTSPGGGGGGGSRASWRRGWLGWEELRELNRGSEIHATPHSFLLSRVSTLHPCRPPPNTLYRRACATSAEPVVVVAASRTAPTCIDASPKSCHRRHLDPHPPTPPLLPQPKWGGLAPT